MSRATGFDSRQYSVTLPPFPEGDPQANWGFKPDAASMGELSILLIVSAYPIVDAELDFEKTVDGLHFYTNPQAQPRARVIGGDPVDIREHTPNRLVMVASGPGTLVTSEIAYPGWEVEVDGSPASLQIHDGLLRAVQLSAGEHDVEFIFRPGSLHVGALITLLGLVALASLWIRR